MSDKVLPMVTEGPLTPVFDGRVVKLFTQAVTFPSGHVTQMELVRHVGAAAILPLHDDGSVTLVYQYRHATGQWLYELPAGLLEAGEAPDTCAHRELQEEVGLTAKRLTPLTRYYTAPGFSDEVVHLFLAEGLLPCEQALEADELLRVVRMPLSEALNKVQNGRFTDGKTIIGLLMIADRATPPPAGGWQVAAGSDHNNADTVSPTVARGHGGKTDKQQGNMIDIYTDGACSGNPGPGGWGALIVQGGEETPLSGYSPHTTNNRMELLGAIRGLEALEAGTRVNLTTDSKYVKDGITQWIHGWKRNGWKTAAKKPVKNADLWRLLDTQVNRHQVAWNWVKGHNGHPGNERADALATSGIGHGQSGRLAPDPDGEAYPFF